MECFARYHQTKLANSVFALALHSRLQLAGSRVKSLVAEPGVAATDLTSNLMKTHEQENAKTMQMVMDTGLPRGGQPQSAADGACPLMMAAFSRSAQSGDFFMPRERRMKLCVGMPVKCLSSGSPPDDVPEWIKRHYDREALTLDEANQRLLWHASEKIAGSWTVSASSKL